MNLFDAAESMVLCYEKQDVQVKDGLAKNAGILTFMLQKLTNEIKCKWTAPSGSVMYKNYV